MADPLVDDGLSEQDKRELLRDLKEAFFSGATRVRFRERDVSYRSLGEMQQIIDALERELAGRPKRKQVILTTFSRGY